MARARALGIPIPPELDVDDSEGERGLVSQIEQLVGSLVQNEDEHQ